MAADRVADIGVGPRPLLAVEPPRGNAHQQDRQRGANALANRARLRGAQGRARVSTTTRAGGGWASTTTAPYASPPTPSSQPSELGFPPHTLFPSSDPLPYLQVSARGEVPIRPERHN